MFGTVIAPYLTMAREVYEVKRTEPEFGYKSTLFIEIDGKRSGLSPWLNLQEGDRIVIERQKGRNEPRTERQVESTL